MYAILHPPAFLNTFVSGSICVFFLHLLSLPLSNCPDFSFNSLFFILYFFLPHIYSHSLFLPLSFRLPSSTAFLSTSSLLSLFFTYENVLLSMSDSDAAFVSLPLPDCSIIICSYLESLISCSISFLIS